MIEAVLVHYAWYTHFWLILFNFQSKAANLDPIYILLVMALIKLEWIVQMSD